LTRLAWLRFCFGFDQVITGLFWRGDRFGSDPAQYCFFDKKGSGVRSPADRAFVSARAEAAANAVVFKFRARAYRPRARFAARAGSAARATRATTAYSRLNLFLRVGNRSQPASIDSAT